LPPQFAQQTIAQRAERSYFRSKALKMGAWGKENKSFPSPIYPSHILLFQYPYFEEKDFIDRPTAPFP